MKHSKLISTLVIIGLLLSVTVFADEDKSTSKSEGSTADKVEWLTYDAGLEKAKKEGKHLFIDFTASWCGYCKQMDKTTFVEPEIVKMLNDDFIPVKVWGDSNKELDIDGYKITEKNLSRQEYRVQGFPTFWFLDSEGTKLGAVRGYQPAGNLKTYLEYVKEKKYAEKNQTDNKENKEEKN